MSQQVENSLNLPTNKTAASVETKGVTALHIPDSIGLVLG